jgi:uncharacterized surface protein with fasciclin (FAS1) repeats
MKIFTKQGTIFMLFVIIGFVVSCQDKWEDHTSSMDSDSNKNLFEVINEGAEYSRFADLLNKSGYADVLKSSKNFTLILPNNAAIAAAAATVDFNDSLALRSFVGYHIINSIYPVNNGPDTIRAKNLRGKYVDFVNGNFNNINPGISNQATQNGVYHVVNQALTPYKNIYQFLLDFDEASLQKNALLSFDTAKVVGDTTLIFRSPAFVGNVLQPMLNERQKYTYFVLKDDFFLNEYDKLKPYYQTSYLATGLRPDSTTEFFTKLNMLHDLIVPGDFSEDQLSQELTSISGFKFQVDKSKIISSHLASNGRVYYVSSIPYQLANQIREFKVLGNLPRSFIAGYNSANIYYRNKRDLTGEFYNDIEIYDHRIREFYVNYINRGSYKVKYKVYGRAISGLTGDPQTVAFTQYVQFYNPLTKLFNKNVTNDQGGTVNRFTYVVSPRNHIEVYLGEYEKEEFGNLELRLQSGTSVTINESTLILEYLRFEPVLP